LAGLPAGVHLPAGGSVRFVYYPASAGSGVAYYNAHWTANGVTMYIDIFAEPMPPASENACASGSRGDRSLGCDRTIDSHGLTYVTSNATRTRTSQTTSVDNFRPDGTHVVVAATGAGHHPVFARADMVASAQLPGLTLHP